MTGEYLNAVGGGGTGNTTCCLHQGYGPWTGSALEMVQLLHGVMHDLLIAHNLTCADHANVTMTHRKAAIPQQIDDPCKFAVNKLQW